MNSRQVKAAHAFGEHAAKKWTKRSAVSVARCRVLAKEWLKAADLMNDRTGAGNEIRAETYQQCAKQLRALTNNKVMSAEDLEAYIRDLRLRKGWVVTIECAGVWIVTIEDKETHKVLAQTGMSSLKILPLVLEMPLEDWPK